MIESKERADAWLALDDWETIFFQVGPLPAANQYGVPLWRASLSRADLRGVPLEGAILSGINARVQLQCVKVRGVQEPIQ
jgi:uncharacterized protein YjbI with pentapeptide repeats